MIPRPPGRGGAVEPTTRHALVFVRRGCFIRSANGVESLLDPTLAYCMNPGEEERFDHPRTNGDDCTTIALDRRVIVGAGLAQSQAVRVTSVEDGSPAAIARLKPGDFIVGLDGHTVASVDALHQLLGDERVGRDVIIKVLRAGEAGGPLYITVRPVETQTN